MSNFKIQPLLGKPFSLGQQDCFELVVDFYEINFGIEIPNFSRPNDWEPEKDNLIEDLYSKAGFKKLDVDEHWPPRPADVLACTVGGSVPNHLIVFLGNNQIIHHKESMFSSKEVMRPAWRRYTSYILRHPEVNDLTVKKPTLELMEVYREGPI